VSAADDLRPKVVAVAVHERRPHHEAAEAETWRDRREAAAHRRIAQAAVRVLRKRPEARGSEAVSDRLGITAARAHADEIACRAERLTHRVNRRAEAGAEPIVLLER